MGAEVVRLMKPFGVEAALGAIEQRRSQAMAKRRQVELALKQTIWVLAPVAIPSLPFPARHF